VTESLKQYIKETLERGESCPFKLPYVGHDYCYLLENACGLQGHDEFTAGILPDRTRFKGCCQKEESWCEYD